MPTVYIIGTCDTKNAELSWLRKVLSSEGIQAKIIDVSTQRHEYQSDISNETLVAYQSSVENLLELTDRGAAIIAMSEALSAFLAQQEVAGVIGIGGSGGTSLITKTLRALPLGVPKVMISTMASGNTRPFVEATDIMMIYSVTDLAGLNSISRKILANGAQALAGMVRGNIEIPQDEKPALGMTMFGVTTPCVQHIRRHFEDQFDCVIFHATGIGGLSFEKLIASGMMRYVMDITLTEVCDHLMGGILSAGKNPP